MNKGSKITNIIFEVFSTVAFTASLFWVGYFIYYIPDFFSNANWSGLGSAASFIFYLIHGAINLLFIIICIILASISLKKKKTTLGNICLFSNLGYLTIHVLSLLMMIIVLTSK